MFDAFENLIVTGGSGDFLGATGFIDTVGTLKFVTGSGVYTGKSLYGRLDAPGIPEPASWSLMIGGFGLAGASLRARRRRTAVS